jgi:hypothetical protein
MAALAIVVLVVAGACGDPNATPAPAPTTAPTPTAVPTPSPSPVDVTDDFVRIITAPDFSATATVNGTVMVGPNTADVTGNAIFAGPDSSVTLSVTGGEATQAIESVAIGSKRWGRKTPGPWLAAPDADPSEGSMSGTLATIASVKDLGVEEQDGRPLHHLQPGGGGAVSPAILGFDVEGATDPALVMDFYATDDGTPAVMRLDATWTQTVDDVSLPIALDLEFAFSGVGTSHAVSPPEDVWVVNASKPFKYSMAHPADWTIESSKTEDAYAIDGQPYVYVAPQQLAKGATLDAFVADLQAFYKDDFGVPTSQTATSLGGQPATRLVYQFTNDQGQDVTFVDDISVRGRTGWEVFLVTAGGASDIPVFDQFVATFQYAD